MNSRRRDKLIAFERYQVTTNDYNEEVQTWAAHGQAWADIKYGTGAERREAAREVGSQPATFIVPDGVTTRGITIADRIIFEGAWDIQGIAKPNRGEIEFSAVRSE